MTAVVTSSNDVRVVLEPPGERWVKVARDLRRPPTTRAMQIIHEGRTIWVSKVWLRIFEGSYYARDFTIKEKPQQ